MHHGQGSFYGDCFPLYVYPGFFFQIRVNIFQLLRGFRDSPSISTYFFSSPYADLGLFLLFPRNFFPALTRISDSSFCFHVNRFQFLRGFLKLLLYPQKLFALLLFFTENSIKRQYAYQQVIRALYNRSFDAPGVSSRAYANSSINSFST